MSTVDLTDEEQRAVAGLKRLAKRWPKSLWLFSASGELHVMKKDSAGRRVAGGDGISDEHLVDTIAIENDGGDW